MNKFYGRTQWVNLDYWLLRQLFEYVYLLNIHIMHRYYKLYFDLIYTNLTRSSIDIAFDSYIRMNTFFFYLPK